MDAALPDRLAAVDLGSNSFHLVTARVVDGEPVRVDRMREQVQLAAGVGRDGSLDPAVAERALACLERFGECLAEHHPQQLRVVGTSALRRIRDRSFLRAAEKRLGHRIEVVPGTEEARLIYLGVAHTLADDGESRLVIDIGGGSTECILGRRFEAQERHSLHMGCVDWSRRFFAEGDLGAPAFAAATLTARMEVQTVESRLRACGWHEAVGSSGTVRSVAEILEANGWSSRGITHAGILELERALLAAGRIERVQLEGLREERRGTLAAGVAILRALFEGLGLGVLEVSQGAMRDGLLYDLLGRIRHEDVRERTIRRLQERGRVDLAHAARVESTALSLLQQVGAAWGLEGEEPARFLAWAARVHEIGLEISWSHHHRHAAYLLQNSDMPGFSREDQHLLAAVVRSQRRRVRREAFEGLDKGAARLAMRLVVVLRLALLLHRARGGEGVPLAAIRAEKKRRLLLSFPPGCLEERAMLRADLERERHDLGPLRVGLFWS